MRRGEIWWADLRAPVGSGPGYRRPVLILQSNVFNESRIATVVVAAITSNLDLARAPGNVLLDRKQSRLPKESVINVSQIATLDRRILAKRVTTMSAGTMRRVDAGVRLVLAI